MQTVRHIAVKYPVAKQSALKCAGIKLEAPQGAEHLTLAAVAKCLLAGIWLVARGNKGEERVGINWKKARLWAGLFLVLAMWGIPARRILAVPAQTIYNSSYVSFGPDGKAWTTRGKATGYTWYEKGTTVETGIPSSLRSPGQGEHVYWAQKTGTLPVGKWVVQLKSGHCIHNNYPREGTDWHGLDFGRQKCRQYYDSGWIAYCADCGGNLTDMFIYMDRAAAASIDYLDLGTGMSYYYLCPHCRNLEQGVNLHSHACKAISWNQYKVLYDANCQGRHGGHMVPSTHMYNNATTYQGMPVTPITHLTRNQYIRIGYEFVEWNTRADGTGTAYGDGEEIWNLTQADCHVKDTWTEGNQGIVTLYAQWRPSKSILQVDPAGGSYGGNRAVTSVTGNYGEHYVLDTGLVEAPAGYRISFETNGGSPVAPLTGTQHFVEWSMVQPFGGRLREETYYYIAPDGTVDTIQARYAPDPVFLPATSKQGFSFGGWYYDAGFGKPAGGAGASVIPSGDLVLYAQWIDLQLASRDNYAVSGGRGAVDLSWSQSDGKGKVYRVSQSRDGETWTAVNGTDDISNGRRVEEHYAYGGRAVEYTVPYTGLYTLKGNGAQGADYGMYTGGLGGQTVMEVWLEKGEKLTITTGGRDGYENGGKASVYGSGGGATTITSNRKGLLLVAGGGGGASPDGEGGPGGSTAGIIQGGKGQDGMTGGGGGYQGGVAGERIVHHHNEACYIQSGYNALADNASIGYKAYRNLSSRSYWSDGFHNIIRNSILGDRNHLIPVLGNAQLKLDIHMRAGHNHYGGFAEDVYIGVYDQNGNCFFRKTYWELVNLYNREHSGMQPGSRKKPSFTVLYKRDEETGSFNSSWTLWTKDGFQVSQDVFYADGSSGIVREYYDTRRNFLRREGTWANRVAEPFLPQIEWEGTWFWHEEAASYRYVIDLPQDVTGLYVVAYSHTREGTDGGIAYRNVTLLGGRWAACGYQEGQVVSSMPAYGGSSYVNTAHAYDYTQTAGIHKGDGDVLICSERIGYVETLSMEGVQAPDLAAPDAVSQEVTLEPGEDNQVLVTWKEPGDAGTAYYHKVESYLPGSEEMLCRSNITRNTLVSGIRGYYVLVDEEEATEVTEANGKLCQGTRAAVDFLDNGQAQVKYLHVAPVDVAGNRGVTTHIPVENAKGNVPWKLYTRQMEIEEGENVYQGGGYKTWYVKSDGKTPFALRCKTYMEGIATREYQPNYTIFEFVPGSGTHTEKGRDAARHILYTPSCAIQKTDIRTEAAGIRYASEGDPLPAIYPYGFTVRSQENRNLEALQKFTLAPELSGERIRILPVAGADWKGTSVYSEYAKDQANGMTVIADGEGPVISGMEILEQRELIEWGRENITLQISAVDLLSGLKDLTVTIVNTDNDCRQTWTADGDGVIQVELTADEPIYSGSFTVTARAVDQVGNVTEVVSSVTEFALEAYVERILPPHDPVFKRGESGILTITVRGYAERVEVEFPEEMANQCPGLNQTYVYTDRPSYVQEEKQQFMIPLDISVDQQYSITVRAFKGEEKLEEHPAVGVIQVEGTILDEIRTRLR